MPTAPTALDTATHPARPSAVIRRIGLGDAAYRALLADYCRDRLGLKAGDPDDDKLVALIRLKANRRFAFVAFLTERCRRGKADARALRAAVGGEALYRDWLAGLHLEYGEKLAWRMRQVLALLDTAERAHVWVFGEGLIKHPTIGAPLTPLPAAFPGLPLPVLQTLLLLDPPPAPEGTDPHPEDRFNPVLLMDLQQLQGVLAIHRGDRGISHYRIGLKALGPALRQDPHLAPLLARAPAQMVTAALDAIEAIAADLGPERPEPRRHRDWGLFEGLAPYLQALVALAGAEDIDQRWPGLQPTAERVIQADDAALEAAARTDRRLAGLTLLTAWAGPVDSDRGATGQDDSHQANLLAGRLSNRGIAHENNGDLAAAIADYDAAVAIREGIRDALRAGGDEAAWSLPLRNDLAAVMQNRGNAHVGNGDLAAAIADYDAAVAIGEGIRDALRAGGDEAAWSLPLRVDLARVYANRAMALGPMHGAQDLIEIKRCAGGLRALGRDRAAVEVDAFAQRVQQFWRSPAGLAAIRRQTPVGFWVGMVLLAPLALPIRGVLWLMRRARRGRRREG